MGKVVLKLRIQFNVCLSVFLFASIIFVSLNANMNRIIPEPIEDSTWAIATSMSILSNEKPPLFSYWGDIRSSLEQNGLTKNENYLSKLGVTYPSNLTNSVLLEKALSEGNKISDTPKKQNNVGWTPLTGQDFGLVILYTIAFLIFGVHLTSLFNLLLLILATSLLMFLKSFFKNSRSMVLLNVLLFGQLLWLMVIERNNDQPNLLTFVNPRALTIVGFLPCLYIACAFIVNRKENQALKIFVAVNSVFIWLVWSSRSSFIWAIGFLILVAIFEARCSEKRKSTTQEGKKNNVTKATYPPNKKLAKYTSRSIVNLNLWLLPRCIILARLGALTLLIGAIGILKSYYGYHLTPTTERMKGVGPILGQYPILALIGSILILISYYAKKRKYNFNSNKSKKDKVYWEEIGLKKIFLNTVLISQLLFTIILPLRYFSHDLYPAHVRYHNAVIGLVFADNPDKLFKDFKDAGIPLNNGDTLGYFASFREYLNSVAPNRTIDYFPGENNWGKVMSEYNWLSKYSGSFKNAIGDFYASKVLLRVLNEHPRESLSAYKNKVIKSFVEIYHSAKSIDKYKIYFFLLSIYIFISVYIERRNQKLVNLGDRFSIKKAMKYFALLLPLSITPYVWAYPILFVMTDFFITSILILSVSLYLCFHILFHLFSTNSKVFARFRHSRIAKK